MRLMQCSRCKFRMEVWAPIEGPVRALAHTRGGMVIDQVPLKQCLGSDEEMVEIKPDRKMRRDRN